jgi:hypothetical protein
MSCPLCGQRKARRQCPALAQTICPVCCGTKRLVEIRCPADCGYLSSSREHPAAVVKRRQQRDVAMLLPTIRHLTERQYQLFFLFQMVVARHTPAGLARLLDEDVADAAGTLAATFETSTRGVIYEHTAQSPLAQALITEMTTMVTEMREQGATVHDHEIAVTLRALEQGARTTRRPGEGDSAYLELMARLLQKSQPPDAPDEPAAPPGSLIIP